MVLVVEAGVGAAVPKAVPKEKPPVLAAGALRRETTVDSVLCMQFKELTLLITIKLSLQRATQLP